MKVETADLQAAAATLSSVGTELAQHGDLGLGATDLGSEPLSVALSDFCERAHALNTAFVDVVSRTGTTVHAAGTSYLTTEQLIAGSFQGRGG